MSGHPAAASRRHDVPPTWVVPLLLIGLIIGLVAIAVTVSWMALFPAGVAIWWLETRADAFVRAREAARD